LGLFRRKVDATDRAGTDQQAIVDKGSTFLNHYDAINSRGARLQ
jgi:hypothetical protein